MTTPLTQLQRLQELEEIFEHRFVFEKPDRSYPYEILMRVNSDQTRSIATPQDIAKLIDDVAERVETSTLTSDRERQARELQKVRESCICKDKGVIELLEEQNKEAKSKIASLYLPAHEVSHGKDCIECKEIAAYNAAIQDAIKAITVSYHSELDQPINSIFKE